MKLRKILTITAIISCLMATASNAQAQDKITIMVGGISRIIYLPAKLAEDLGYFKEQGLDVTLLSESAGVNAANELLAGSVQGVVGFYDHTIDLQAKGKYTESVVQFSKVPGVVILVSKKMADKITHVVDFKGKTTGITGIGSSSDFLMQYMANKAGVSSDQFTRLPVGGGNTFIAALTHDRIDAGLTTDPEATQLVSSGEAKVLVDLRTEQATHQTLGGLYPGACLYMENQYVKTHPQLVQKLVNAFVKTLHYINTHRAAEIAEHMPKDYYGGNKALYIKSLEASLPMFTADGVMPKTGPETVLNILSTFKPTVKNGHVDLSKTYTTQFVQSVNN